MEDLQRQIKSLTQRLEKLEREDKENFSATKVNRKINHFTRELVMQEISYTPPDATASNQAKIYIKGNKLIFQFNDAGTERYKYLDLTGTGVTWVHTTTAP